MLSFDSIFQFFPFQVYLIILSLRSALVNAVRNSLLACINFLISARYVIHRLYRDIFLLFILAHLLARLLKHIRHLARREFGTAHF